MNISQTFIQSFFFILCLLFSVNFSTQYFIESSYWMNVGVGILGGGVLACLLFGIDLICKRFNLLSFNTAILGLMIGYLMSKIVLLFLDEIMNWDTQSFAFMPSRFFVFVIFGYIGIMSTLRAANMLHLSIPFIELRSLKEKRKDFLVDVSILNDPRMLDLASSGLLDQSLLIPYFSLKELYIQSESTDEFIKTKARRSLETIKKLETLPSLHLRYTNADVPDIKDPFTKLIYLARVQDAHILSSDFNRFLQPISEGIKIINIPNTLKSSTQAGETITIKIIRTGKEDRQGIGYLEDGSLVVVNGGAEYIGSTIQADVISVHHTPRKMIFCNVSEKENISHKYAFSRELEHAMPIANG
jgi:uncharacterized protein YacL